MPYRVQIRRGAQKQLNRIQAERRYQIIEAIGALSEDPRPHPQSRRLQGREGRRLRVGDYRVLYAVDDEERTVTVAEVWHRQRDYR